MSVQTSNSYSAETQTWADDEIDLRRYLMIVLAWWREIVLFTLLVAVATAVVATLWRNSLPTTYIASVDIVIARLYSQVQLDDRVQTTNEVAPGGTGTWRASLLELAGSTSIAQAVITELGDQLPEDLRNPLTLANMVEPVTPETDSGGGVSNIIRINVTTLTPTLSALIANSWAKHYIEYVNGIFGDVPGETIASVEAEVAEAQESYAQTETELQTFVANNQIFALQRQISEKNTVRNGLLLGRNSALDALVTTEYAARTMLFRVLASAPYTHTLNVIATQSEQDLIDLAQLRRMQRVAETYLDRAVQMQAHLEAGGEVAARNNVQALQLLKAEIFAAMLNGENLPSNMIVQGIDVVAPMSLADQLQDVQSLVTVLEEYMDELEAGIAATAEMPILTDGLIDSAMAAPESAAVSNPAMGVTSATVPLTSDAYATTLAGAYAQILSPNYLVENLPLLTEDQSLDQIQILIEQLEGELNSLQAQLAAEQALERQLTQRRDIAWTAYETTSNKLVELNLLRTSANSEVRMGSQALVPLEPMPLPSLLLPVAALTVMAFLLMLLLVLIAGSLGYRPVLARQ